MKFLYIICLLLFLMTALPVESLAYGPNDNLLKAISLFRSEQYSEALDLFYQELAKNPTDTNIMGWIAGTLEMLGQYEDALNIENQILATDLSYSEDLDDKLELLLKMGRYNEALDVSDQQIAMLGGDGFSRPRTIFLRGKTLSLLGRYNEALGFFDSLIRDGSLKGESLEQKALIMEKLGQDYEALDLSNSQLTPSISDTIHTSTAPINLLPDLTITKISMKQKENVIAGTLTIENKGSGDAGKFTITYFLTDTLKYDPIFGNNDIFVLGEDSANGLAVGDQRDSKDTKMFTIPGNVSPGSYAVGVFIDSNNVEEESDEENNVVYDISWVQVG